MTLSPQEIADRVFGKNRPQRPYDGAEVKMFPEFRKNEKRSLEEKRPCFDEIPSISIQYPGMDITVRKIEQHDKDNYPELWAAYEAVHGEVTHPLQGTPLKEWSMMPRSIAEEFAYVGFRTVEQVATANDAAKKKLGSLQSWIKRAKDWLKAAESDPGATIAALTEQVERLTVKVKAYEDQNALLIARIESTEGVKFTA